MVLYKYADSYKEYITFHLYRHSNVYSLWAESSLRKVWKQKGIVLFLKQVID